MKVLVANRGEIACRILHSVRSAGYASVAVYTDADADAPHVWMADEAVGLGAPMRYLDIAAIIDAATRTGATMVHPGYGFLAENPAFAQACTDAGLVFVGPSTQSIAAFADKRAARELAVKTGVPVIPGAEACDSVEDARVLAGEVGYPVLLKAAAGGGGKGMRLVNAEAELVEAFEAASHESQAAFNDGRLLLEKYIYPARHVEVQILGNGTDAMTVGDRECSLQRRYQKIIEEAPCAAISDSLRQSLFDSALTIIRAAGYCGAGTVEFLVGPDEDHYFLEVNTRLQVEHPVTELVTGMDLVAEQLLLAQGGPLPSPPTIRGHAIEARINAEDAYGGYLPQTGEILMLEWSARPFLRIDAGITKGSVVSPHYDSMLAKMVAWGATREEARLRLIAGLEESICLGVVTNQMFLADVLRRPFFISGQTFTTTVEAETWTAAELPPHIAQLATEQLERRVAPPSVGGDASDRYSPWQNLGKFRMGQ